MFNTKAIMFKIFKLFKPGWILGIIIFAFVFNGATYHASAAATCIDGTSVPAGALAGGREYEFCSSHGGYNGGDASVCNDGTKIPDSVRAGGRENDFCTGRLGYSGGTPASATTEVPRRVKNDCDGDNIRAGLPRDHPDHCGILDYLTLFIKFLSGLVGVVVVAMITVGGIQYSISADDPNAVNAAKKRIFNAILALVLYIFTFALLQYLIPGGVI